MSVLALLAATLVAYAAFCAFVYATQRALIYFPTPESAAVPGAHALQVGSGGESIKVWVGGALAEEPGADALIYFGGNADEVSSHLEPFAGALPERALYLVNYRGYGGSSGTPSEAALSVDAEAVYDRVRARHPSGSIAVLGRSLGAGVAVHLAATRPVDQLVLVTPFDSLVAVARVHFRALPVDWLLRDRFDSIARVAAGEVRAATLIVIAVDDEVVPAARGEALAAAFPSAQVQVQRLVGARHNTVDVFPQFLDSIAEFLDAPQP